MSVKVKITIDLSEELCDCEKKPEDLGKYNVDFPVNSTGFFKITCRTCMVQYAVPFTKWLKLLTMTTSPSNTVPKSNVGKPDEKASRLDNVE